MPKIQASLLVVQSWAMPLAPSSCAEGCEQLAWIVKRLGLNLQFFVPPEGNASQ